MIANELLKKKNLISKILQILLSNTYARIIDCKWIIEKEKFNFKILQILLSNTYARIIDCKWIIEKEKFNFKNITNIAFKYLHWNDWLQMNYWKRKI